MLASIALLMGVCAGPAPAQTPAPPVIVDFILFFGFDDASLTPTAQTTLDQFVGHRQRRSPDGRVLVVAHSDRAGSAAYNLTLSTRRGASIRAYLVAKGVPAERIEVMSRGDTQPLVPTTQREPQNRRADVLLQ